MSRPTCQILARLTQRSFQENVKSAEVGASSGDIMTRTMT